MKSTFILITLCIFLTATTHAQNVGIGTSTPNANAVLEIKSNSKGLLMSRLSTTARNSMTNVAKGMLVYDTTRAGFYYHDGGKWLPINQSNSDSLLRYTYPGVAPIISSMPANNVTLGFSGFYGTLYDNGGASGNYNNSSNSGYSILTNYDSTVLIKIEVIEMNLESPYDSLEIYSADDYEKKQVFTGTRTGIFYFRGDRDLEFTFRSNSVNNLSGFKINWTKITTNSLKAEAPPLTGWYFNTAKSAARGGVNINNNWATDSLGSYTFAFGQNAVAKGDDAYAVGNNSAALGESAIAMGLGNTVSNYNSTAIGSNNKISGGVAFAVGNRNDVRGSNSFALGFGLILKSQFTSAIGYFNDSTVRSLFAIGNGTPFLRSNALTILDNGNTGIGTTTASTKLDVDGGIRTKYSGSVIKSVTGTGSAALVNLTIPALPSGWDLTNTLMLVSLADGTSGIIYRTKLTSTSNIELFFEANATGATRFNYIVFKL